jgi:uncharacterized protein YeaO (DUF488 family)
MIRLKRVYDSPSSEDGKRFLVERLWPRGVKKSSLLLDEWLKDVAPSTELRKWFGHDHERWHAFCSRYFTELRERPESWHPILQADERGPVTLLYSSHDATHNNAVALKKFVDHHRSERSSQGANQ